MCLEQKEWHDLKHAIYEEKLEFESIILLYETYRKKNTLEKLSFNWLGLYKVSNIVKDKSTYMLKKLNRLWLISTFTDNKLKKFDPWQQFLLYYAPNLDYKNISTIDNLFSDDNNNNLSDASGDFQYSYLV